jgi:hypothetical protein
VSIPVSRAARGFRLAPWTAWRVSGALGGALWAALAVWTPPSDPAQSLCLFRHVTHLDCPGCGLTRSISALAHGDLAGSIAAHPLGAAIALQAALAWLGAAFVLAGSIRVSQNALGRWVLVNIVALLVFGAARLAFELLAIAR